MIQTVYRTLFIMFIIAGCVHLSAQERRTDAGVWLVGTRLNETTLIDIEDTGLRVTFDERASRP